MATWMWHDPGGVARAEAGGEGRGPVQPEQHDLPFLVQPRRGQLEDAAHGLVGITNNIIITVAAQSLESFEVYLFGAPSLPELRPGMAGAAEVALGEVLVVLADEAGGVGRAGDVFGQGGPELLKREREVDSDSGNHLMRAISW